MGKSKELFMQIQEEMAYIGGQNEQGYYSNIDAFLEYRGIAEQAETIINLVKDFERLKISEISQEASLHNNLYKGFQIKENSGRKLFDFKKIAEWQVAKKALERIEEKYKSMFVAKEKGNPHANISEDGEELPLPEINFTKSFLTIKKV